MERIEAVSVGDLIVEGTTHGVVLETRVNMWGEEVIPSGVRVMWADGDISVVYEDEVDVILCAQQCHLW